MKNNSTNKYIEPAYKKDIVAICATCSNEYVPYLSVWLASIKKHASKTRNYDIVILEDNISEGNKIILKEFFETSSNLSLRFYNPSELFVGLKMQVTFKYVSKVSFYRLGCAIYFKKYDKLITTDLDLIFNDDPAILFDMDMNGKLLLAVLEPIWSRWINCNVKKNNMLVSEYAAKILHLNDLHRYFNTGVALLDIKSINKQSLAERCLNKLKSETIYVFLDQDVLNEVFRDYIGVLPYKWNYAVIDSIYVETAIPFFKDYCNVDKPSIIHYLSEIKPWNNHYGRLVYKWWELARYTPFYEQVLLQCIQNNHRDNQTVPIDYQSIWSLIRYSRNKVKKRIYSILTSLTFGKLRAKYKTKKSSLKAEIRKTKNFIKTIKGVK